MTYGAKFVLDNGKTFDTSKIVGSLVEVFTMSGGSSGTRTYPELAGFKIMCVLTKSSVFVVDKSSQVSINYTAGYPTITWAPFRSTGTNTTQTVFVIAY